MTTQNTAESRIRGAEGLLDLGFFEDAAEIYQVLAQEYPDDYRVWLGIARTRSQNFTQHNAEVQTYLDRAADCAKTVDAYNDLQETAGWYAQLKPYAYARQVTREMPDTEQLARIKPIRVPLSTAEGVKEARDVSRLKYLKFLLVLVIILALPTLFIISCTNGTNPIMNAIQGNESGHSATENPATSSTAKNTDDDTASQTETTEAPAAEECPYKAPSDNISAGMEGEYVRWVQWCLNHTGYTVEETGVYDDATERTVREFQKKYEIRIDGIVGPETREQLHKLLGQ